MPRSPRNQRQKAAQAAANPPRFEPLEPRVLLSALPDPGLALTVSDIKGIFAQAITRATALGVNATISLVDREGNILGVVRMTDASLRTDLGVSTIGAGGLGGLEGVTLPSSIFATSKAGTAAFLSTTGNAFSTRTAGFIIQEHFPAGIRNNPGGPLFGVQLSSLPTSDLNRLPIGLAADPGGIPLYRSGQVVAGIGVEFDGAYTAPASLLSRGGATEEELVAAAGAAGFPAPSNIRADNILVGGVRFPFSRAAISSDFTGSAAAFDTGVATGRITVLVAPTPSPATKFTGTTVGGVAGDTVFGFQQGFVSAFAVRGNDAFIVQPDANLAQRLSRIDLTTGVRAAIATISGTGANQLTPGHAVGSMAIDDLGTADTTDDLLYVFEQGLNRVGVFSAATGAGLGVGAVSGSGASLSVGAPQFTPLNPLVLRNALGAFVLGIDNRTGNLVRLSVAGLGGAQSPVQLTTGGAIDSFTIGEAGVFGVQSLTGGTRQLISVNTDASGSTVIANISDGGPNEGRVFQPITALAYNNNGTATTADDFLIAQNSTTGRQFNMSVATGAIANPGVELANPRFVLTGARLGPNNTIVGVGEITRQLQRITLTDPSSAANLSSLTAIDTSSLTRAGVDFNGNIGLTAADAQTILAQAHQQNAKLRAMIRRDNPQVSQVTVSVVDAHGNLLGVVRTPDAPVFGFDVSAQKARSALFFSRPDAGAVLNSAEAGIYAKYLAASQAARLNLDGSVALSEQAIGFIARPFLPDGIPSAGPGPLSALAPDVFSPFNTGLQTQLIMTNIFKYANEFAFVGDEGAALRLFVKGLIGGGGVTVDNFPLQNGLQIFPGSMPLYKNGVLVGGVGVSGDGIDQDGLVAFSGAKGFQDFGPGVRRADQVKITKNLRLPYVKFPRNPSGGL